MDRSLRNVLVGTFTLRFSTGLTGLLLTFYLAHLPTFSGGNAVSAVEYSLVVIAFYATELTLSPVFGILCDRIGRKRIMESGPAFGAVAVIATGLTAYLPLLLGTRLLEGASTAASVPAILGFMAVATARDESLRGRASAAFEVATIGGLVLGGATASLLWDRIDRLAFFLNAGIYGVSWLIYRFGVRDALTPAVTAVEAARHGLRRYLHLVSRSHALLLAPTWVAINAVLGVWGTQTIFQLVGGGSGKTFARDQVLMRVGGFSGTEVFVALVIGGVTFFAGMFFWGNLFKRLRRTTILAIGLLAAIGGILVVFAVNHWFAAPLVGLSGLVMLALGALFVLAGATPAALGLLQDVSEGYPRDRGAIMGLYSVFLAVGQIFGAAVAGVAAELRGIDGVLGLSLGLILVALIPLNGLRAYEHQIGGPTPAIVPHPEEVPLD